MSESERSRLSSAAGDTEGTASRISSPDQIVRDVVRGIYEGRYVAGQRLVEPDLMGRYEVGRSSVREAIKRLAAEGVVSLHAYRGARIRQLSRREARDVLTIMELLVGLAARLAAENIEQPGAHAHFTDSYRSLAGFAGERDSYDFVRARNRFYRAMTRIGGNGELHRLLPSFQVHHIRSHVKIPQQQRFADYERIAEAILAGDAITAESAARAHIRRNIEALSEAPDQAFAPEPATPETPFPQEDTDHA